MSIASSARFAWRDKVVDDCEVPLGIRIVRWDVKDGLFLNGRHVKLHGWGQKPTDEWPGLGRGAAGLDALLHAEPDERGGRQLRALGPLLGGPAQIEAADRLGIIADQPGVDGESDTRGAAWKIRAAAFRDTIIYFRNNPSILIWEGGNQKVSREHAKELRGYMDQYDPHGGRAYAHRRADKITAEFMDVGIGTEGGREIASLPVVEGEYNREESPRRVWDDASPPELRLSRGQGPDLSADLRAVRRQPGGANTSASSARPTTAAAATGSSPTRPAAAAWRSRWPAPAAKWTACACPRRRITSVAAMFRSDPQVHIIGHWTYPAGTKKTVYVASNGEEVELLVNGKSLGRGKVSDRYLFTFPDVAWEPGEIKAVAYAGGKAVATQTKRTVGPPVALRLTPITGPGGLRADGSDVALIDVEAVDARGRSLPDVPAAGGFRARRPRRLARRLQQRQDQLDQQHLPRPGMRHQPRRRPRRSHGGSDRRPGQMRGSSCRERHDPVEAVPGRSGFTAALAAVYLHRRRWLLPRERTARVHRRWAPLRRRRLPPAQAREVGRFTTAFSYSGPTTIVHVEQNAQNGKNVYVDRDYAFAGLPAELVGADWVQAANGDSLYNAVDLMEVAVKAGAVVSIAHDDRLPRPAWLTRQFQPSDLSLAVNGQSMKVFQRRVDRDESLTLGANTENPAIGLRTCTLYLSKRFKRNDEMRAVRESDVVVTDRGWCCACIWRVAASRRSLGMALADQPSPRPPALRLPPVRERMGPSRPRRQARLQDHAGRRPDHGLLLRRLHGRRRGAARGPGQEHRQALRRADDTAAIQEAIDKVSAMSLENGFRGAVLLAPGDFTCSGRSRFRPAASCCAAAAAGRAAQTIKMVGSRHAPSPSAARRGRERADRQAPKSKAQSQTSIADAYVPSGATTFTVADATGFAVGDTIAIRRPVTAAWVKFMQMDNLVRDGRPQTWIRAGTSITTERTDRGDFGQQDHAGRSALRFLRRQIPEPAGHHGREDEAARAAHAGRRRVPPHPGAAAGDELQQAPYSAMRISGEDCWVRDVVSRRR